MRHFILTATAAVLFTVHAAGQDPLVGKVVETKDVGSYTYMLVDNGKEKIWAAVPQCPAAVGDQAKITDAMVMKQFRSKALNRTFDTILFAAAVELNGKTAGEDQPALPAGHPPLDGAGKTAATEIKPVSVKKPEGGHTVAECFEQKQTLAGKTVKVRGTVVKFNSQIMGKNWVHLRDGTGGEGSNDLTVTTADVVRVGDTVLCEGNLTIDKDFGAGYKYDVIVENAKLTKE